MNLKSTFMPLGSKRFKFEDHLSFFSLSGSSNAVHLLDHRHFHILDVVVVGQIEVLGHGETSSSLHREVTGATPGSVARKCSWWGLVLLRAGGKGTMDQDVTEIGFPPMDAQGLVVKYVRSGWVFS